MRLVYSLYLPWREGYRSFRFTRAEDYYLVAGGHTPDHKRPHAPRWHHHTNIHHIHDHSYHLGTRTLPPTSSAWATQPLCLRHTPAVPLPVVSPTQTSKSQGKKRCPPTMAPPSGARTGEPALPGRVWAHQGAGPPASPMRELLDKYHATWRAKKGLPQK